MNVEEIKHRVESIGEISRSEGHTAHRAEDALYVEVLAAIRELGGEAGTLAKEALKSRLFMFERMCAAGGEYPRKPRNTRNDPPAPCTCPTRHPLTLCPVHGEALFAMGGF